MTSDAPGRVRVLRRLPSRGALLRALRTLVRRVEPLIAYGLSDDQCWAARLHTRLTDAFAEALAAPGSAASLAASDVRRQLVNKTPARKET
jgi:hypothetical protein